MATPENVVSTRNQAAPQAHATRDPNLLVRYGHFERLTHWAVAISYVFLFLSGLALFHPFFFWTSALFGGGTLMRILHPFCGVVLAVLFYPYAARLWRDNFMTTGDWAWSRHIFDYMNKRPIPAEAEQTGKYNAGQKMMFWSMIWIIGLLLLSGIVIWQPYFAPSFSNAARRVAAVVHAVCAFIMFVGMGIHVYAAYWTKGSIRAMTHGTVTRAWARMHHPGWYRQIAGTRAGTDKDAA